MGTKHELKDLTGQTFGRLTVLSLHGTSHGHAVWNCVCTCGKTLNVMRGSLLKGATKSCGCLRKDLLPEFASKGGKAIAKHGDYSTRLYRVWSGMKARCNYTKHSDYPNYGGRGIKVCSEWQDFKVFKEWSMANGYDPKAPYGECTIDRVDNDKGYSPDNCRWVAMRIQNENRRNNKERNEYDT